jgi:hypothetical protein
MGGHLSGVAQATPDQKRVLMDQLDATAVLTKAIEESEHETRELKLALGLLRRANAGYTRMVFTRDTLSDLAPSLSLEVW